MPAIDRMGVLRAATSPSASPVPMATARVKASTAGSSPTSWARGMKSAPTRVTAERLVHAKASPSAAPPSARRRLSATSCATICARPAPSETRIPISLRRFEKRASTRFATFAHAMSSTAATAAKSME